MRRFCCERCRTEVEFEASVCPVCAVPLGYIADQRTLRALTPSDDGVSYALSGGPPEYWRCLNSAWGCNWMVRPMVRAPLSDGQVRQAIPNIALPAIVRPW